MIIYLPTKTFGIIDKISAQTRIAKLIKQARLSQNLVQVIQQNQKLTAINTQLQTQIQKLTLENKTIADKKSLEGYNIGIKKGTMKKNKESMSKLVSLIKKKSPL